MREAKAIEKDIQERKLAEQREDIKKRTVYVPQMNYAGARTLAAVLRSADIYSMASPDDNQKAFDLAGKYLSGDECLPERITLGGLLKVLIEDKMPAESVAFFMPTAGGPCRFGQYRNLIQLVLQEIGYGDVLILSPSSNDAYKSISEASTELMRTAWWAVVSSDIIQKILLKTRPYELNKGDADTIFEQGTELLCSVLERKISLKEKYKELVKSLTYIRDKFRAIPVKYTKDRPLIGIVGEIFCRMNAFSNEDLIREVENLGGECWLSDISEWLWYTNRETKKRIVDKGKRFSKEMAAEKIKNWMQHRDEHYLVKPFEQDLRGYEEPENINVVLDAGRPYLPVDGALGEMVLSVGKAVYFYEKGADGIIDISPFTCMNGIVAEAVYPDISKDHDNIPIKNFYFDGTITNLEQDLDIFLELTRNYNRNKRIKRIYPECFNNTV